MPASSRISRSKNLARRAVAKYLKSVSPDDHHSTALPVSWADPARFQPPNGEAWLRKGDYRNHRHIIPDQLIGPIQRLKTSQEVPNQEILAKYLPDSSSVVGRRHRGRLAVDCRRGFCVRYNVESRKHASRGSELVVIRVHNIVQSRLVRRIDIKCLTPERSGFSRFGLA